MSTSWIFLSEKWSWLILSERKKIKKIENRKKIKKGKLIKEELACTTFLRSACALLRNKLCCLGLNCILSSNISSHLSISLDHLILQTGAHFSFITSVYMSMNLFSASLFNSTSFHLIHFFPLHLNILLLCCGSSSSAKGYEEEHDSMHLFLQDSNCVAHFKMLLLRSWRMDFIVEVFLQLQTSQHLWACHCKSSLCPFHYIKHWSIKADDLLCLSSHHFRHHHPTCFAQRNWAKWSDAFEMDRVVSGQAEQGICGWGLASWSITPPGGDNSMPLSPRGADYTAGHPSTSGHPTVSANEALASFLQSIWEVGKPLHNQWQPFAALSVHGPFAQSGGVLLDFTFDENALHGNTPCIAPRHSFLR